MIIRVATLLVAIVASPAGALAPEAGYRARPSDYGILYDEVTFTAADGVALRGWFFPIQDTTGVANALIGRCIPVPDDLRRPVRRAQGPRGRAPTVIVCPGDAGNMTYAILHAYNLFTRGFNVFTFDMRGFGESATWPMDRDRLAYTEFLSDYRAALDHVRARPEVGRVGLLGFSTGAYLAFAMAAERDDVAALAVRALITSFDDLLAVLAVVDSTRAWRAPEDYPMELLPASAAPLVRAPVLLIVGAEDSRTPLWMSRRVYEQLPGQKELWVVPEAEHGGAKAPELVAYDAFVARVAAFFERHLADSGVPRLVGR